MESFALKFILRCFLWLVTRHRLIQLRDWLASVIAIIVITVIGVWKFAESTLNSIVSSEYHKLLNWDSLWFVVVLLLAFIPLSYILKLRRLGITDADYSVETGIDYSAALTSVTKGFRFAGVGASKLCEKEQDFRDALTRTAQHRGAIQMLLVNSESSKAIKELEDHDSTYAYQQKIEGTQLLLQSMAKLPKNNLELRYYSPNDVNSMRPFRLFFTEQDCLLSPFRVGTGVKDRGRGLPQLRITSSGFPSKTLPTLFTSFEKYFDSEWIKAEKFDGGENEKQ